MEAVVLPMHWYLPMTVVLVLFVVQNQHAQGRGVLLWDYVHVSAHENLLVGSLVVRGQRHTKEHVVAVVPYKMVK